MSNLSDYIEERGEKRGEERGRKIGEKNATVRCLEIIMESLGFSIDEALKFLKVPDSEKEMYIQILRNR